MVWLRLAPPVRQPVAAPPPVARAPSPPAARPHASRPQAPRTAAPADAPVAMAPRTAAPAHTPLPTPPPLPPVADLPAAAEPPAQVNAEQMLAIARRDLGKIDRDLRKEQRRSQFNAEPDSRQLRLEKGIEEAHAAVPNKWYQAAKIEDITPPGDDARKIYRITGALGTYCVRYPDKNRVNQGKANAGEPLIGACPHMF